MLERIECPEDIKQLNRAELVQLAEEIRRELIAAVTRRGGHLASSLGTVELIIALHRVFDSPKDKILFDVGHQAYAHKLLTGRRARFDTLRSFGGISGFPRREESEHDVFGVGHSSTAISAAAGFALARDLHGTHESVVAVVGDGALTGGMCYEALNDVGHRQTPLIVVLNDNEMSISPNVGAVSHYLTSLRQSAPYKDTKNVVRGILAHVPWLGKRLITLIERVKNSVKHLVVNGEFFEALGFDYMGPIDGHDIPMLIDVLSRARRSKLPTLVHVITQKGRGDARAESHPDQFHGVSAPVIEEEGIEAHPARPTYGSVACESLMERAAIDPRIVVITAAMCLGTGFQRFAEAFPARAVDVGIAEQHATTIAAGLAAAGMRPVFAVYSTFLQRAFDQVLHDICIQKLPVLLLIDRAGLSGEDGATHQGAFDLSYLRLIPGLALLSPRDSDELRDMIDWAFCQNRPIAIRYGRTAIAPLPYPRTAFDAGVWDELAEGEHVTLIAEGRMVEAALKARELLGQSGVRACVLNARSIKPLDMDRIARIDTPVVTIEENTRCGGLGAAVLEALSELRRTRPALVIALPDDYVEHGNVDKLREICELQPAQIARRVEDFLRDA